MSDFVTLSCPTCSGKLDITKDIERFACGYCGNEHVVRRGGGIVSLIPIADDIKGIKTGVDKTAAELAIIRLTKELEKLINIQRDIQIEVLTKFYKNHVEIDSVFAGLDFNLYRFIYCLIEEVDGLEVPVDMSDLKFEKYFKQRIFALTEDDLIFLTEIALFVAIKPEHQKQIQFRKLIDEFHLLSDMLFKNEKIITIKKKIPGIESELDRMKEIVSN